MLPVWPRLPVDPVTEIWIQRRRQSRLVLRATWSQKEVWLLECEIRRLFFTAFTLKTSASRASDFLLGTSLTWMGMKRCHGAPLLYFSSFTVCCDALSSVLRPLLSQYKPMGKNPVWVSCDAVVTRCGHYVKLASKLGAVPGGSGHPCKQNNQTYLVKGW